MIRWISNEKAKWQKGKIVLVAILSFFTLPSPCDKTMPDLTGFLGAKELTLFGKAG
ncbi:MAG: hypothetical protein AB7K68_08160 [Bacteriovoracia bacterium]